MLSDGPATKFPRPKRPLKAAVCGHFCRINVGNPLCILKIKNWLRNVGGDRTNSCYLEIQYTNSDIRLEIMVLIEQRILSIHNGIHKYLRISRYQFI